MFSFLKKYALILLIIQNGQIPGVGQFKTNQISFHKYKRSPGISLVIIRKNLKPIYVRISQAIA